MKLLKITQEQTAQPSKNILSDPDKVLKSSFAELLNSIKEDAKSLKLNSILKTPQEKPTTKITDKLETLLKDVEIKQEGKVVQQRPTTKIDKLEILLKDVEIKQEGKVLEQRPTTKITDKLETLLKDVEI
ncbi:MAG: hypothetical protein U9P38_04815, partial [Campylobacterota bacterium]|nr:hypothetical protein [Campylobacterota bacterium]